MRDPCLACADAIILMQINLRATMVSMPLKLIVFTDLDGTFLDHHSYGYEAAMPALQRLQEDQIPIITVTSKTLAELDHLNLPFGGVARITENGMAIEMPVQGDQKTAQHHYPSGKTYRDICQFVQSLPSDLRRGLNGFNDMTLQEVMQHTGLPEENAARAKQRMASEPFLWSSDKAALQQLRDLAAAQDLQILQGGRFYHLTGLGGKDHAIGWFLRHQNIAPDVKTVALGDGPNDALMLACVDYGIKIPNASGASFDIPSPKGRIMTAPAEGPKGWSDSLNKLLDEMKLSV